MRRQEDDLAAGSLPWTANLCRHPYSYPVPTITGLMNDPELTYY